MWGLRLNNEKFTTIVFYSIKYKWDSTLDISTSDEKKKLELKAHKMLFQLKSFIEYVNIK